MTSKMTAMTWQSWESARDSGGGTCTAVQLGNYMRLLAFVAYDTIWHGTSMVTYIMERHGTSTGTLLLKMSFREACHGRPRGLHRSSLYDI